MRKGHEERNRVAAQKRRYLLIMAAGNRSVKRYGVNPNHQLAYDTVDCWRQAERHTDTHTAHDRLTASADCQRQKATSFAQSGKSGRDVFSSLSRANVAFRSTCRTYACCSTR